MVKVLLVICLLGVSTPWMFSQPVVYSVEDSLKVVELLTGAEGLKEPVCLPVYFARRFTGIPYVGGTLDRGDRECLVVNLHEMDCTTFVEYVMALTVTAKKKQTSFRDFVNELVRVRYRDGVMGDYCSRLHYFSDWIWNNEQKGIVREKTYDFSCDSLKLHLDYMTAHCGFYRRLKSNTELTGCMKETEESLSGRYVPYIPKEKLMDSQLQEGDIVGIMTNIKGLDIVHTGFAFRKEDGRIYLLHASLQAGKVVIDETPLKVYLRNKTNMTGIRILTPVI